VDLVADDAPVLLKAILKGLDYHNKIMMNDVLSKVTDNVEDGFWRDSDAVVEAARWPPMVHNYFDSLEKMIAKMVDRIERAAAREVERKKREAAAKEEEEREQAAAELEAAIVRQKELDEEAERQAQEEEAEIAAELLADSGKRRSKRNKSKDLDVLGSDDDDANEEDDEVRFQDADPQADVVAIRGKKTGGRKRKRAAKDKPAEPNAVLNILSRKLEEDL